jgi:hypothetical protein
MARLARPCLDLAQSSSAAISVRRPRPCAAACHNTPSAPPTCLLHAAERSCRRRVPSLSRSRSALPLLKGEGEWPAAAAADAVRALPGDALRRRREEELWELLLAPAASFFSPASNPASSNPA